MTVNDRNVVLTALPRGGNTTACYLIGKGSNTMALNEPIRRGKFAHLLTNEPLESHNLNEVYDRDEMMRVGERLLESEGAYWHFYTRENVEALLKTLS